MSAARKSEWPLWVAGGSLVSPAAWLLWLAAEPLPLVEDPELAESAAHGQTVCAALGSAGLALGCLVLLAATWHAAARGRQGRS